MVTFYYCQSEFYYAPALGPRDLIFLPNILYSLSYVDTKNQPSKAFRT